MIFIDSSVLIAASLPSDPRHEICIDRLAYAEPKGASCAAHTLAEIYSVLTRLPGAYRVPSSAAIHVVQATSKRFSIVYLTAKEYLACIENAGSLRITGGTIYDALILACARKANATKIYTLNRSHFQRAAPDLAALIHEP